MLDTIKQAKRSHSTARHTKHVLPPTQLTIRLNTKTLTTIFLLTFQGGPAEGRRIYHLLFNFLTFNTFTADFMSPFFLRMKFHNFLNQSVPARFSLQLDSSDLLQVQFKLISTRSTAACSSTSQRNSKFSFRDPKLGLLRIPLAFFRN